MDAKKVSELLAIVLWLIGGLLLVPMVANAAPDPNFHIYIAYGQSNMDTFTLRMASPTWKAMPRTLTRMSTVRNIRA